MQQYALSFKEADALTQDAPSGNLLDEAVAAGATAKRVTNLLLGRIAATANERGCCLAEVGITAGQLAELAKMMDAGTVSASAADRVLVEMIEKGGEPLTTAKALNLLAVTDTAQLEAWVDQAITANPEIVAQIRAGDKKADKARGFLMGQIMKLSAGKAPPAQAKAMLERKLIG
jgi:aspartyl-tRNA(Asn)/glutamyl-tRNA(Gln) amidotransferase subunit B